MAFNPATSIPSLSGRVILLTGGKGIGGATVKLLAENDPRQIYICARSRSTEKRQKLRRSVRQSKQSTRHAVLNSGISTTAPALTEEGYQSQFGIKHLGHALLAQLLMPTLLRTIREHKDADVGTMVTSSTAHEDVWGRGLDLSAVKDANVYGSALKRYGHSKLANILFARALAQHYPEIISTSYYPGVVKTEIWHKDEANPWLGTLARPCVAMLGRSVENGAWTGLSLATQKGVENGAYYEPIGMKKAVSKFASDQEETDKL